MHPAGQTLLQPVATLISPSDTRADTLVHLLGQADYLVVRNHLPLDVLDCPHHLRGIVRHGTGLDMIPVDAATRQGIPVANVPGANAQAVAEYVVGSFLNLTRHFSAFNAALRTQDWAVARRLSGDCLELSGKTVGIVGVGAIGKRIAHICSAGLGMTVLGYQPDPIDLADVVQSVSLEMLLTRSDFVTINCPLTPQTRHLIDSNRLRMMQRTAFLVNAARGEIVDEQALAQALKDRVIAAAALDVYAEQPLPRSHAFFGVDNVVLTPHVAGLTKESFAKMSVGTANQVLQLMNGERPTYLVNPEVWAAWPYRTDTLPMDGAT
jgi:D-3-phosphoglycerate dehydrogenase